MLEKVVQIIDGLLKNQKIFLKIVIVILLVLGVILFLPFAQKFGIDDWIEDYGAYFYVFFLICVAIILLYIFYCFQDFYKQKKISYNRNQLLHSLTREEQFYLLPYIMEFKTSLYINASDGVISALKNKKIVYTPSRLSVRDCIFAYNLHRWAWEYLYKNQHLLNGGINVKEERAINKQRDPFVKIQ